MHTSWPKDFLFGAATSAHQVEGGNHNDWTEWEHATAERKVESAKGNPPAGGWPDYILKNYPNPLQPENYISGIACDHYHRYEEDFNLAQGLDHNAHRFSIEWSRIEPEEGRFNEKEIEHYKNVAKAIRVRGMEPFVTLWHWTLPLWVRDKGGLMHPHFEDLFARYSLMMATALKNDVTFWMTLNEPNAFAKNAYLLGIWPPNRKSFLATGKAMKHLARAHIKSRRVIRHEIPHAQVGFGSAMRHFEPKRNNLLDRIAVRLAEFWSWDLFFMLARKKVDYIAPQYYQRSKIAFPLSLSPGNGPQSDLGWEIYPQGLYELVKKLSRYKKPIYITENGVADARDAHREQFIREHLAGVRKAIEEGVDIRGYFHWSLLDNFEWDKGFWPRFGLVEVDYKTLQRTIRPSALVYKKIIESGL